MPAGAAASEQLASQAQPRRPSASRLRRTETRAQRARARRACTRGTASHEQVVLLASHHGSQHTAAARGGMPARAITYADVVRRPPPHAAARPIAGAPKRA